jgi:AraC-like DNA-binding protein
MPRARSADIARHGRASAKATGPTMWARVAARIAAFAEAEGAPRRELLAASALSEGDLEDPDGRVPLGAVYELVERATAATGDDCFGLHFAVGVTVQDLDALGFLVAASATLGEALERIVRYQRLWNDGERYALSIAGGTARVTYTPYGPSRPAHRQMAEIAAADMAVNAGQILDGDRAIAARVRFQHAAPADTAELERVLAVPIEWSAPVTEILLLESALARPLRGANEALCAFFERYTSAMVGRLPAPGSAAARVRRLVGEELPIEEVSLSALAAKLRVSPRTLQRRLSDEGTSLQAEVDQARRERAAALLDSGASIAEIVWLLGYSEPSAFHRAFKRWTGQTPEAWRAERRGAA